MNDVSPLHEITEDEARKRIVCPACGSPKDLGCMVCWNCFKYRMDIIPLKYFRGSFAEWMESEINDHWSNVR